MELMERFALGREVPPEAKADHVWIAGIVRFESWDSDEDSEGIVFTGIEVGGISALGGCGVFIAVEFGGAAFELERFS